MPVESREAGRWKRDRQTRGTKTLESADNGSTRGRDPRPLGGGGTNGLTRRHVGNLGKGFSRRKMFPADRKSLGSKKSCPIAGEGGGKRRKPGAAPSTVGE